jgi:hypothetical protein
MDLCGPNFFVSGDRSETGGARLDLGTGDLSDEEEMDSLRKKRTRRKRRRVRRMVIVTFAP